MWQLDDITPPRLSGLYDAVRTRLAADSTVQTLLGGADPPGRVNMSWMPLFRGDQATQWQRLVIVPVSRPWQVGQAPSRVMVATWNVRVDVHMPEAAADPMPKLELLHVAVHASLHGWIPGIIAGLTMQNRIYRQDHPDHAPLFDSVEGVHFQTAEYRGVCFSPDAPIPS